MEIILKSESIGLKVMAISSDMGPSNQKHWNVTVGKHQELSNFICHPIDNNRKLYIIPDVPHLFKNIKNMLMTNKIIFISKEIQQKFNLPTK